MTAAELLLEIAQGPYDSVLMRKIVQYLGTQSRGEDVLGIGGKVDQIKVRLMAVEHALNALTETVRGKVQQPADIAHCSKCEKTLPRPDGFMCMENDCPEGLGGIRCG